MTVNYMKKKFYFAICLFYSFISIFIFTGCNKKLKIYPFLRLGIQANDSSIEYMTAIKFGEEVNRLSNGEVEIKIFTDGQFGDDISMIEQLAEGTLDITYTETGRLGIWVEEAQIFGYPFAFDDFSHLKRTLSTDYGKSLQEKFLKKGWRVLATAYNGTRQTTSNKKINSIEDMKDMKFRVPNAYANMKFAEYAGTEPVILPFNEVYTYLKADIIDGQENPLSTIDSQKFYEVQKYCALTNHIINDNNIIISEKTFSSLSSKQKKAISEAAKIAAKYQTELFQKDEIELIEKLKSEDIIFTTPDRQPFRDACQPMYDEYISKYGSSAVNAINSTRNKKDK